MISMPHPCSEDFSKMRKTEIGAYCNKCRTETIDLFKLTKNQVNHLILKSKLEGTKICGRITHKQMALLNKDFITWKKSNRKSFHSKFLFAILIGFGLTLFSCSSEEKKVLQEFTEKSKNEIVLNEKNTIPPFPLEHEADLIKYIEIDEPIADQSIDVLLTQKEDNVKNKYIENEVQKVKNDSILTNDLYQIDEGWYNPGPIRGSAIQIEDVYFEYLIDTNNTKK